MRPAWSIIVFTSLSGFGLGMLFWFGLGFVTLTQLIDLLIFGGLALIAVIGVVFYGESLDFYLGLGAALILVANYLNLKRQV